MTLWRVVGILGRVLLSFGILVLLFAAYLLWGTGLVESGHQNALRQEFSHALAERHIRNPLPTPSTSGTVPSGLVDELASGRAPAEGQPVALLDIPKIGLHKVVVEGTAEDDLRLGPGHYAGTPLPGQSGNVGIAGHRTTYGAPFYNVDELTAGDRIVLTTLQGRFSYVVIRSEVVDPTDVAVLRQSTSAELTLTTCNPRFSASQRLVVLASLLDTPVRAPVPVPSSVVRTAVSTTLAGTGGSWGGAVGWGLGVLAVGGAAWTAARRLPRVPRWAVYGASVLPVLVVLFFFYAHVAPLLPASF